jgi:hypothetical protein
VVGRLAKRSRDALAVRVARAAGAPVASLRKTCSASGVPIHSKIWMARRAAAVAGLSG